MRALEMGRRLRQGLALGVGVTVAAWGGCTREISDKDIRPIALADVRKLAASKEPDAALIVDPRSAQDYRAEHIPGARSVSLGEAEARVKGELNPELAAFRNLVVYGNDPGSAIAAAMTKRLMEAGHNRVWLFRGGLAEWKRAGLKTESTRPDQAN